MSEVTEVLEAVQAAKDRTIHVLRRVCAEIRGLPDNPKIMRINKNCFTIRFRDLGSNWSVLQHDHLMQYRMIADEVEQRGLARGLKWLLAALRSGCVENSEATGGHARYWRIASPVAIALNQLLVRYGVESLTVKELEEWR